MAIVGSSTAAAVTNNATKRIYNETIISANAEQSLVMLDTQISGYMIKVRGDNAELKLTHVSGESGTKFITIPENAVHTDEHPYTSLTIYFQATSAGVIVEVVSWA